MKNRGSCQAPAEMQCKVRRLVDEHGLKAAAHRLHLSPETTARMVAGLGVRRGSILIAEDALARLESAADQVLWSRFRAHPRPVFAFMEHVRCSADPDTEFARLVAVLEPSELAALGPEIEAEKKRRDAWFGPVP